jgi:hypothetical protein
VRLPEERPVLAWGVLSPLGRVVRPLAARWALEQQAQSRLAPGALQEERRGLARQARSAPGQEASLRQAVRRALALREPGSPARMVPLPEREAQQTQEVARRQVAR